MKELYSSTDDKLLDETKGPSIELKAYEIPPETLCKGFQKAYSFLHPTKEQAQWWVDHKDEINKIMCLNLKPEDSLCEYVDKELKKIHNEGVIPNVHNKESNKTRNRLHVKRSQG